MAHVSAVSNTMNPWQISSKIPREADVYLSGQSEGGCLADVNVYATRFITGYLQ